MPTEGSALLRRSAEVAHAAVKWRGSRTDEPFLSGTPVSAQGLMVVTVIGFYALFVAAAYSYMYVVGVLTTVESTEASATVAIDRLPAVEDGDQSSQGPKAHDPLLEEEMRPVPVEPAVTSSIGKTIRHLRIKYGYWSRFRGFGLFVCMSMLHQVVAQILYGLPFMRNIAGAVVAGMTADLILTRLTTTWVHIVMSEPTGQWWWRRVLPAKAITKVLPAMALYSVVNNIISPLPLVLSATGLKFWLESDSRPSEDVVGYLIVTVVVFLSLQMMALIRIPAAVILVRVAASTLPSHSETVVGFDRSFGGRLDDEDSRLGLLDAWRSVSCATWLRILKLAVKVLLILCAIGLGLGLTVGAEVSVLSGQCLGPMAKHFYNCS